MRCHNVAERNAAKDWWLWKRVGDFFPAASFSLGWSGGYELEWGAGRHNTSHAEAVRVSMLPFYMYAMLWLLGWNTHRGKWGGACYEPYDSPLSCGFKWIHGWVEWGWGGLVLSVGTENIRAGLNMEDPPPSVIAAVHHSCATFTCLALLSLWNHF